MKEERYIVVRNWDIYQHPDVKRTQSPAWVKLYTRLLHDDAFMELSEHRRYIFLMLLTHYALSHEEVTTNTARLSHVFSTRVVRADLKALIDAGYITLSASKPASKRAGNLLDRAEEKRKEEKGLSPSLIASPQERPEEESSNGGMQRLGVANERFFAQTELMPLISDADEMTWDMVAKLSSRLPVSILHGLREQLSTRHDIESPVKYVVGTLRAEIEQRKVPA